MTISYRANRAIDFEQLASLFRTAGWHSRADDRQRLMRIVEGSMWVQTAWEGDLLVGFARAITDGETTACVTDVVVHEEHRGQGIGSNLIRQLMDGRDHVKFVLHAEPEHHGFYERLGFEVAADMMCRPRCS